MSIEPEEFQQLKDSVKRIETAIIGDGQMGVKGFVKTQEEFNTSQLNRITSLEKWQSEVKLSFAFVAGGAIAIVEGIKYAFEWLANSHNKQ